MFVDRPKSFNRKLTPNRFQSTFSPFHSNRIFLIVDCPVTKTILLFENKRRPFSIIFVKENLTTIIMKNILLHTDVIQGLLQPETDIENKLIADLEFRQGLFWGKPRYGHPEGKVIFHISEVLKNIDLLKVDAHTRGQLRLITYLHDTFKHSEDMNRPRDWSRHHSVLARKFGEKYIDDQAVLNVIEHHDEAFYSWRAQYVYGKKEKGELRMQRLLNNVKDHLQLFYLFFKCDTQTGDKNQKPLLWFEKTVNDIEIINF